MRSGSWVAKIEIRLGGNRLRSMAHAGSASGYCQAGKPFMCIEANLSFISIREHTRLAERWVGKACRRGSLRWLLLRASVSCDAQQLIAISHQAPNWTSASLLRPSRLPVATPAASQPPPRASWGQRSGHAGCSRACGRKCSLDFSRTRFENKCHENVTMPRLRRLPTLCRAKRLRALIFQLDAALQVSSPSALPSRTRRTARAWRGGRAPVWRDRSRRSPVAVAVRGRSA